MYSEKAFLIFMLVSGIFLSVLVPLYQVPDESTHINMIYQELGLNADYSSFFGQYSEPMDMRYNFDIKVNAQTYFNNGISVSFPGFSSIVSIATIKHLPQAVGLLLCSIFHCSIFVTSIICESFAVLFSSFICYYALKLIPSRKLMFASVMALPLCLQQNGSFSYDAVLMPVCFLLIAYLFNIKFIKEKFTIKDLVLVVLLGLIIAIIKIPYIVIFAIVFLIPSKKYSFKLYK